MSECLLSQLLKKGSVYIEVTDEAPAGSWRASIDSLDDAMLFLSDSDSFFAKKAGVPLAHYQLWKANDGNVKCGRKTRRGKACRQTVLGGFMVLDPRRYSQMLAEDLRCNSHS